MAGQAGIDRAFDQLATHRILTLVWTDDALCVLRRQGDLAPDITVGSELCETALALHGMQDQVENLRQHSDATLIIPNVSVIATHGAERSPRLNYIVMWDGDLRQYLLAVMQAITTNDVTIELQRQVRRRLLIEAELAEQARAIEAANEALSRANRDLSDFARIVSHDLKSPMRALRYMADDLERSLADPGDNDDPRTHLELLRAQSRRMSSMLTGLLAYARQEHKELAIESVDTRDLVRTIVGSLPRPEEFVVRIEGDWPRIDTYEAPLDLILRNLIDNAIKHHDRADGKVVVNCKPGLNTLKISITDDGPGIDARYREAVFQPYTRLEDSPGGGEGMGLTLVKQAADSVSARLTVEEPPAGARGAVFTLDWPKELLTEN